MKFDSPAFVLMASVLILSMGMVGYVVYESDSAYGYTAEFEDSVEEYKVSVNYGLVTKNGDSYVYKLYINGTMNLVVENTKILGYTVEIDGNTMTVTKDGHSFTAIYTMN